MSKKWLFILFNVIYFFIDWIIIPIVPNKILFGTIPLQLFLMLGLPVLAAVVWGLYYNNFFKTQSHVNYD
ncbi:hypothetical protein FW755_08720 [Lonepinella koalarum]|uniref:Uncharacterized protein n=1 Tax=Lonepinella koalarum TaxID=53417 RepID=A0A4V2PUF1_9PAST|nr:hypothetical protein [Lonepinella koalarum]TCK69931.1 hypothetical protein EV692_1147 [Lonepinella koalarum]TFJ90465.1 hypothetical protein E0709_03775 [Lonepinella koalarum]TYG35161.1 hypothetical protein FW755_08720 [Lonepinella koalarum]